MEQTAVVLEEVARLEDTELIIELQRWVRADRSLTARLLVHLGEVDARRLYRERAWPSMFAYAVEELHMSESEAYVRIAAARLGRQFPRVVELLAQGALHLTAIKLLGPHLTADNHLQVLERARGKVTREIELIVAELAPKPDVPNRIRKLPTPVSAHAVCMPVAHQREVNVASAPMVAERPAETTSSTPTCAVAGQPEEAAAACRFERGDHRQFQLEPAPRNVSSTTPLRPGRYKVEFTAGEAMHCKLEQLKALLRHQVPDGDLAIILERAADLLIEKTRKERFAQTTRPRKRAVTVSQARAGEPGAHETRGAGTHDARTSSAHAHEPTASKPRTKHRVQPGRAHSRYIPRSVVREVHARDGEQCTFMSPDGRRCPERGFLEFHHHDTPYARDGAATTDNLKMVCRTHNALFAERDFGRAFIQSKLRHARLRKRDEANELVLRREPG